MPGEDGPREGAGHSKTQQARLLDFCFRVLNANRYDEIQLVSSIPRTPKRSSMRFFRGEVLGGKVYGKLTILFKYFQDMCMIYTSNFGFRDPINFPRYKLWIWIFLRHESGRNWVAKSRHH